MPEKNASANDAVQTDYSSLIRHAFAAREKAYAPYSGYRVGAALLTEEGKVYTGCNVENAAFSPTNCAERTAFFKAISEGCRRFSVLTVVGGAGGAGEKDFQYVFPCGVCRQVMAEFCGDDFRIVVAKSEKEYRLYPLKEILPHTFGPGNLRRDGESAES